MRKVTIECLLREIGSHSEVRRLLQRSVQDVFPEIVDDCLNSLRQGRKMVFIGNGGSAADTQQFETELVARHRKKRQPIPAVALTTDTSALTAIGNDFGFDDVFASQIQALANSREVAIGISTSGNSENVTRGLLAARTQGAVTVAFTGGTGGKITSIVDQALVVPSTTTARIQEMHLLLGHGLCELLETHFDGPKS